jgi:outer membrane lipoprotein-sorting protein
MKKLILSLWVVAASITSFAQNAEEIAKKHIEAIGGEANWRKVKNMRMDATTKANGADIKVSRVVEDGKAMRMDIEVFGMKGWTIITKTEGWAFMPFQGQTKPEAMTADDVKSSQEQLACLDEFITYKELGKRLEYVGKDEVDGVECQKVKLIEKDGKETSYWIDPSNYYIIKSLTKTSANGKEVEATMTYSNYKKLESGIVVAMSMGGDMGEIEINSMEVNAKLDEKVFKPITE